MKTGPTVYTITLIVCILSFLVIATHATDAAEGQAGADSKHLRVAVSPTLETMSIEDIAKEEAKKKHELVPAAPMNEFKPIDEIDREEAEKKHENVPAGPIDPLKPISDDSTATDDGTSLVETEGTKSGEGSGSTEEKGTSDRDGNPQVVDPTSPEEKKPSEEGGEIIDPKPEEKVYPAPEPRPVYVPDADDLRRKVFAENVEKGVFGLKFGRRPSNTYTFDQRKERGYYGNKFGRAATPEEAAKIHKTLGLA